jgi:flavorubredoxin
MEMLGLDFSLTGPRQPPLEVARDTFLIRAITPSVGGSWTNLNSMVIRGAEPIIVDTGMVTSREDWFEDVFSLVPPEEVRWIFITHNDSDHSGNLLEALERCPEAQLITSKGESWRCWASFGIPFERMRLVDSGESFDLGDRALRAVRPPVYDSPYTRGVFDPTTGVYYASDAFCAPMPGEPVDWVDQIPEHLWADGFAKFHHVSLCPWVALADRALFKTEVDKLASLGIDVILGAHTPAIRGDSVPRAFGHLANLPGNAPATTQFGG